MKILTIFADASHAWGKVSKKELTDLGIANKISSCSNQIKVKFCLLHGEVIALFPEELEKHNNILSYMHVGQHGPANRNLMKCKKASEKEFLPLLMELKQQGYDNLLILNDVPKKVKTISLKKLKELNVPMIDSKIDSIDSLNSEIKVLNEKLTKANKEIERLQKEHDDLINEFEEYQNSDDKEKISIENMNISRGDFLESLKDRANLLKYKYHNKEIPGEIRDLITLLSDSNPLDDAELDKDVRAFNFLPF